MMFFFKKARFFDEKALILPTKSSHTKPLTRKMVFSLSDFAPEREVDTT